MRRRLRTTHRDLLLTCARGSRIAAPHFKKPRRPRGERIEIHLLTLLVYKEGAVQVRPDPANVRLAMVFSLEQARPYAPVNRLAMCIGAHVGLHR